MKIDKQTVEKEKEIDILLLSLDNFYNKEIKHIAFYEILDYILKAKKAKLHIHVNYLKQLYYKKEIETNCICL